MTTLRGALALVLVTLAAGCAGNEAKPEPQNIDPSLESNVLSAVPSDVAQRTYVDFESVVHLVGYTVTPADRAPPGSDVKVTMFWQPQKQLGSGWRLFTHVLDARGRQIANLDNVGPLRKLEGAPPNEEQILGPARWEPGKVYVDEQTFTVPKDTRSPEVTIAVGIWRGATRLVILSGPSDGQNRAVVAHLSTGLPPEPPPAPPAPAASPPKS